MRITKRVLANQRIRAARGLTNGGPVPLGHKLIPNNPGHLAIDEATQGIVVKAFDYFLKYESLSLAAKKLNEDGITVPRFQAGGGNQRVGTFRADFLHRILRN